MARFTRFVVALAVLLLVAQRLPGIVRAAGPTGSHYRLDGNKNTTTYSATITVNGHGVWIDVHARQSNSGVYAVPSTGTNASDASSTGAGVSYNQIGSGSGSSTASDVVRSWTNAQGEPYYETTNGQVDHLAGLSIAASSRSPGGWFAVGIRQHPGTVPEALYVNGKLQSIVWVPVGAQGSGLHWGTPPAGTGRGQGNAPIVVDPHAVALEVLRHIPLPDLRIRENPSLGLVALPGWFWAEGYNGQSFGGSATVGTVTVGVQVQPISYTWSFGDGTRLVSHDLGQPYPAESDITHTYQYNSLHHHHGFPVRLTIQFAATYSVNGGPAQGLASLGRTYTTGYRVQELQAVLTSQ